MISSGRRYSFSRLWLLVLLAAWIFPNAFADKADATGFVHIKQIDGVWWFIGPDGKKFVSNGVNHIEPHLWLAPYNKEATLKRYGRDLVHADGTFNTAGSAARKWIDRQVEICEDLHFNTFAKHSQKI